MTGPLIASSEWPEWADRHCWDEGGDGYFYGYACGYAGWGAHSHLSEIALPPGHDWRVPVMRNQGENSEPVAWMRRKVTFKEGDGHTEGERITSASKVYGDDLPLYAAPQPAPAIGLEHFSGLIGFACLQAINLPETDPRRYYIRQSGDLLALIDGQASTMPDARQPTTGWLNDGFREIAERAERLATDLASQGANFVAVGQAEGIATAARRHGWNDPRPHARSKQPTKGEGE